MGATAIIPARYASTRLPGKPLLAETGKSLIQHVVESVQAAERISRIVVATDDKRIADNVASFGCECVMTSDICRTGTDRLAEAADKLNLDADEIVVNVQGDEPDIPGKCIDQLIELITTGDAEMATLARPISPTDALDPSKVKVVCDCNSKAIYFSRSPIPFDRDGTNEVQYLMHLGIYAYRAGFLKWFASAASTPAEQAESLEQLRAIEAGRDISVGIVDYNGCGIDTPEDYAAFVARQSEAK